MTVLGVASDSGAGVERISVATDGTQGDGDSVGATITTDGGRVAFASSAKNLTPANPGTRRGCSSATSGRVGPR